MFENTPLYYILISLVFLIIFSALAIVTWLVWLSAAPFFVKMVLTTMSALLTAIMVIIYTLSAE